MTDLSSSLLSLAWLELMVLNSYSWAGEELEMLGRKLCLPDTLEEKIF